MFKLNHANKARITLYAFVAVARSNKNAIVIACVPFFLPKWNLDLFELNLQVMCKYTHNTLAHSMMSLTIQCHDFVLSFQLISSRTFLIKAVHCRQYITKVTHLPLLSALSVGSLALPQTPQTSE